MSIALDMYQTVAIAVLVLMLGAFLRKKIHFLEKFCIPAPVIGGLLFAILTCILHGTGLADVSFDDTLKEVCMVLFFTSVGFQANLKVLKSGGKSMIVFLILVILLIIGQNFTALGLSNLLGLDPLIGMCTGSIPMVGGHVRQVRSVLFLRISEYRELPHYVLRRLHSDLSQEALSEDLSADGL